MISDFTVSFFVTKYMILNVELSCQLSVWSKVLLLSYKPQKIETYNVNPDKILSYCGTNDNAPSPAKPTSLSRLRSSAIWEISWGLGFTHLRKKLSSVPFTLVSMLVLRFLFRAWASTCSALHIWK